MCCPVLSLNLKDIPICCLRASPYTMAYIEQLNSNDIIVQKRYDTLGGEAVCVCVHSLHEEVLQVWDEVLTRDEGVVPRGEDGETADGLADQHQMAQYTVVPTCIYMYMYMYIHVHVHVYVHNQLRVWDWTTQTTPDTALLHMQYGLLHVI